MRKKPVISPRNEYQLQENQRVNASPLLTERFPDLKSIELDLSYSDSSGHGRCNHIKYTFNMGHARSVFRIHCQNPECIRGGFDLSDTLADALAAQSHHVTGELCCQGWRNQSGIDTEKCEKILRYKLTLGY